METKNLYKCENCGWEGEAMMAEIKHLEDHCPQCHSTDLELIKPNEFIEMADRIINKHNKKEQPNRKSATDFMFLEGLDYGAFSNVNHYEQCVKSIMLLQGQLRQAESIQDGLNAALSNREQDHRNLQEAIENETMNALNAFDNAAWPRIKDNDLRKEIKYVLTRMRNILKENGFQ